MYGQLETAVNVFGDTAKGQLETAAEVLGDFTYGQLETAVNVFGDIAKGQLETAASVLFISSSKRKMCVSVHRVKNQSIARDISAVPVLSTRITEEAGT